MSGRIVVGGRKVSVRDVATVAYQDHKVVVDKGALRAFQQKNKHPPKADVKFDLRLTLLTGWTSDNFLSIAQVRAVLFNMIVWLLERTDSSTFVSESTLSFFVELLNQNIHLAIPAEFSIANAQATLALAASGKGFAIKDGKLVDLSSCGLVFPSLVGHEVIFIQKCPAILLGLLSLQGFSAGLFVDLADVVCAMTMDACSAYTGYLDDVSVRPLSGAKTSSANMLNVLKGSTNINKSKRKAQDPLSFRKSHFVHGSARDLLGVSLSGISVELNANESVGGFGSENPKQLGGFVYEPVAAFIQNLASALFEIGFSSNSRLGDAKKLLSCGEEDSAAMQLPKFIELYQRSSRLPLGSSDLSLSTILCLDELGEFAVSLLELEAAFASNFLKSQSAALQSDAQEENEDIKKKKKKINHGSGVSSMLRFFDIRGCDLPRVMNNDLSLSLRDIVDEVLTASNETKKPKIPKGTRDFGAEQMAIREIVFSKIEKVFKRHGAVALDTPVFELRETLMGKYGEESKLIYDLADQGGELLSLRYDLTVPFARYLAMNSVGNIKRYHIAKVYRRDNPAIERGRFREFYQCDFDIAGSYDLMIPDAEVLKVLCEILESLELNFSVKLNHRCFLDAFLDISGVPADKFRTICSSIDKLDKQPWEEVKEEFMQKGLSPEVADRVGEFVQLHGSPFVLLEKLKSNPTIAGHSLASRTLDQMETLFNYLKALGVLDRIEFDLSLARGLTYYTGIIYEAILIESSSKVGSIAAGGRYDDLVGIFCAKQIPAVGVSIGVERIMTIVMEMEKSKNNIKPTQTKVLVASIGGDMTSERFQLIQELWNVDIAAEMLYSNAPTLKKQIDQALKNSIPFIVFLGADELKAGVVQVKNTLAQSQESVPRGQIIEYLTKAVSQL